MAIEELISLMSACKQCVLHEHRKQVVVGDYAKKQSLCFVGEAPGASEDRLGRPFVGRSGKLLDKMLNRIGYERSDVSVLNIVKCRPPENRTPTNKELKNCGDLWLNKQLTHLEPVIIVTLGSVALRYFFPKLGMMKTKGKVQMTELGIPLYPIYHPAYILRNGNKLIEGYYQDFVKIKEYLPESSGDEGFEGAKVSKLDDFF